MYHAIRMKNWEYPSDDISNHSCLSALQAGYAERAKDNSFAGLTVVATIRMCMSLGWETDAAALQLRFHVKETKMMHCRVCSLSDRKEWSGLKRLAIGDGALLIGYLPFVEEFVKAGRVEDAKKLVPGIEKPWERLLGWVLVDDVAAAVHDFIDVRKDHAMLRRLYQYTTNGDGNRERIASELAGK